MPIQATFNAIPPAIGRAFAPVVPYIEHFDALLNSARGACSGLEFLTRLPQYFPSASALEVLVPVRHTFSQFRDQLQFLEVFNRVSRLQGVRKLDWVQTATLACNIAQTVLFACILYPEKQKWKNVCAFLSGQLGCTFVTFRRVEIAKDLCVIGASALAIWTGYREINAALKKQGSKAIQGQQLAGIAAHIIANVGQYCTNAQMINARKAKTKVTLTTLATDLHTLYNQINADTVRLNQPGVDRVALQKALDVNRVRFETLKNTFIRRAFWESAHLLQVGRIPPHLPPNVPGLVLDEMESIARRLMPQDILQRVLNYKLEKNLFAMANEGVNKKRGIIGNIFETTKISIVALSLAGMYPTAWFWANQFAIGGMGFWRLSYGIQHPKGKELKANPKGIFD